MQHHTAKHGEHEQDREQRKRPAAVRPVGEEDVRWEKQEAPVHVNANVEGSTQFPGTEHSVDLSRWLKVATSLSLVVGLEKRQKRPAPGHCHGLSAPTIS